MNGQSLDITQDSLDQLQALFPTIFTEGKIDFEKFKATFSDDINFKDERYVLNWAGKGDAFKTLQMPTTATLKPMLEESINFDTTENIFIEGENLEVLKVLQKSYYGKVKCIIIDPPYNTGSDSFTYPDNFKENKANYEKRIGDKDEEGFLMKTGQFKKNSKDSGHFHSNWLSMILPRLFLAKNLMKNDGVIFVHIDDNEVHNLRLLMNEIFGEENFVSVFPWKKRTAKSDVPFGVSQDYEWIISYTNATYNAGIGIERKYYSTDDYPNNRWRLSDLTKQTSAEERPNSAFNLIDPKTKKVYKFNPNRVWAITKDTFDYYYEKGKIVFPDDYKFLNTSIPSYRVFESEDKAKAFKKYGSEDAKKAVSTFLPKDVGMSEDGNKEIINLFGQQIFSFPKPINLIKHFLKTINEKDYIILDFFAGSGTTAQAVLELNKEDKGNRKFILVQLPEIVDENSDAYKAGYKTIADISKERIRRVIKKLYNNNEEAKIKKEGELKFDNHTNQENQINHGSDLGFKVFKLAPSNFKTWRGDEITEENLVTQLDAFVNPIKNESEPNNMLYELILKAGYLLTDKVKKNILDEFGSSYYSIKDGELIIVLEDINQPVIEIIIKDNPKKIITLDKLFAGNDQLKTNTALQMKDAGIDFKTI